jgi:hypothetical protein
MGFYLANFLNSLHRQLFALVLDDVLLKIGVHVFRDILSQSVNTLSAMGPRQTIQKCVPAMVCLGVFRQTNATVTVDGQAGRVLSQFFSILLQSRRVSAQEMGSATFLTCVLVILDGTGQSAISLIAMVAYQLMMVFAIGRVDALDQINAIAPITL